MDFKEAYRFPLRVDEEYGVYVFTDNGKVCFNNLYGNTDTAMAVVGRLVDSINGDYPGIFDARLDDGFIYVEGMKVFVVRGWGYLTGFGGLGLPAGEAARIQDEFAGHCVAQLRRDLKEDDYDRQAKVQNG